MTGFLFFLLPVNFATILGVIFNPSSDIFIYYSSSTREQLWSMFLAKLSRPLASFRFALGPKQVEFFAKNYKRIEIWIQAQQL